MTSAIPAIKVDELPTAQPLLTNTMRQVVDGALLVLQREASSFPLGESRVTVNGWLSPEDGSQEIVLVHWTDFGEEIAFEYWDRLAVSIEAYIADLPEELRRCAEDRLSVAVRWRQDV